MVQPIGFWIRLCPLEMRVPAQSDGSPAEFRFWPMIVFSISACPWFASPPVRLDLFRHNVTLCSEREPELKRPPPTPRVLSGSSGLPTLASLAHRVELMRVNWPKFATAPPLPLRL